MQHLLKSLPKVDTLLTHNELKMFQKSTLLPLIQSHLSLLREKILSNAFSPQELESAIKDIIPTLKSKALKATMPTLTRVINATGVIVQTNLGRSVFSSEILNEITPFLRSYHTLEYDLAQGKRSERYTHTTQILCDMFGCEDALLVNNNAAAVLLILNTFAAHKEVIISRGELVEIGGSFRIPEVMKSASSLLCEVGTTNKTHLKDYENAINEQSAMIMKVHQSNFKQIGFVKQCHIKDIIQLSRKHHLIDYFDLGSGHIGALPLADEPSVREIYKYKPSLLSFSGDKLLGGPQVGIIIGKSQLIAQLKQNQLLRALRVDKFSILALMATLKAYQDKAYHKIPTLTMLTLTPKELESKAKNLKKRILDSEIASELEIEVIPLRSIAGGGSVPHLSFDSFGLCLRAKKQEVKYFESALRTLGLISCIQGNHILLDVRTLLEGDEERIVEILTKVLSS
ncbi:L-seryl-tRNA(Sec) selenium transferase [Helicobacter sp. MIT 21-1697]|uniref:L-seryl-tRNA(Sec) selenium transferase n=1 Tax=Helicobacter sp. MIT 21-1697 TaxID=2993733 RepID=UPI00224B6FE3|nr:L-seryl-tRNA(Sec) selenium transferase [Helicobacter sp. MIT 21-1697]MCX2717916.1 L-seryl-tRNA(Sec) selenium transferase [Helicobacter sp. MIT 21-1697]